MLKLYQFAYSPYAAKVRKCLELKRLAFQTIEVPYMDRRELVRVSGQIMIPVLVDGATVVVDSPRITAYLDERYPHSLRPTAAAIVFETWADNSFEDVAFRIGTPAVPNKLAELNGGREDVPAMFRYIKERKFGAGCVDAWAANAPALTAKLRDMLAPLAATLDKQPFLLGDAPTLADAAVWGNLYLLEWTMPGWVAQHTPEVAAWYRRVAEAR